MHDSHYPSEVREYPPSQVTHLVKAELHLRQFSSMQVVGHEQLVSPDEESVSSTYPVSQVRQVVPLALHSSQCWIVHSYISFEGRNIFVSCLNTKYLLLI